MRAIYGHTGVSRMVFFLFVLISLFPHSPDESQHFTGPAQPEHLTQQQLSSPHPQTQLLFTIIFDSM